MLARSIALTLAVAGVARAQPTTIESNLIEAITANPTDATSMLRLGMYLHSTGRDGEGEHWVKAALDTDASVIQQFGDIGVMARGASGCDSSGPDLTVAGIPQITLASHEGAAHAGTSAFGIAASVCNIGDLGVGWVNNTPDHPVAAQNIYRYADGRFTHIGMSWLKHEFFALASNLCCDCTGFTNGELAAGCSDSFSASISASQNILGPRSEVNPSSGAFPYPFSAPAVSSPNDRRCQVSDADINPSLNPGARYFAEVHYVAPTDAAAGNGNNNAAFREIAFLPLTEGFAATFVGAAIPELPAIMAWPMIDSSATVISADVPGDGRFHVGFATTDNGDGTWHYEYAIHNMNSDRAARAFSVPIPAGVTVTNASFSDISYHSGEPIDPTDWSFTSAADQATWTTDAFDANETANALRWGTLYNFSFDADAPPATNDATITLFKPAPARGVPSIAVAIAAPAGAACPADVDGSGSVDASDLAVLLAQWGSPGTADFDASGSVGAEDLAILLAAWGDCTEA